MNSAEENKNEKSKRRFFGRRNNSKNNSGAKKDNSSKVTNQSNNQNTNKAVNNQTKNQKAESSIKVTSNIGKKNDTYLNKGSEAKKEVVKEKPTEDVLKNIMQNPIRSKFNNNKINPTSSNKQNTKQQTKQNSAQSAGAKSAANTQSSSKPAQEKINPSQMKAIVENKSGRARDVSTLKRERLKIIPLGGLEEVGKNITVFEYGNDIILVDCGVSFPEEDMLGVDLVTPDITYLEKNKSKIKGMCITHGHEDHIGSIPYVLKQINMPVYASRLTCGLIKTKLEEHKLVRSTKMTEVRAGETITLGCFKVEFIQSTHSIADSMAFAIHTPVGVIVHTGDFKVDYTPIDGNVTRLAELGKQGVRALMSDSTNSEREGFTMSEKTVGKVFEKIFNGCQKRIIVATFASNVHRVQQIINCAVETDRKVSIAGRSMENVMNVARELGYLDIPDGILIDIDNVDAYPPNRVVIITTGSQGESMAGLSRMAQGSHKKVSIGRDDLVIISAHPIPGNEKMVSDVIDDLIKIGAEVIYHSIADVHVSGHACKEEQKLMLCLTKPKYFIPVHGEYKHLKAHAETAKAVGVPEDNIAILHNGAVLELDNGFCKITGSVPSGEVLVDGLGVGDVGNIVLRDRQHLAEEGIIIVVMVMDKKTGKIVGSPDIISRGFVYVRESEDLMEEIQKVVNKELEKINSKETKDWSTIKSNIKDSLHDYLFQKTKRNPMLIPIITEI
jgi:ribonuclease J